MTIRLLAKDNSTVAVEKNDEALRYSTIIKYKKKLYVYRGVLTTGGEMWYHEETPAVLE